MSRIENEVTALISYVRRLRFVFLSRKFMRGRRGFQITVSISYVDMASVSQEVTLDCGVE